MFQKFRLSLLPFALFYGLITYVRNKLYDWRILKSISFDIPVICVGNLVVGGAGKTPTTEYLVDLLKGYQIAILSRGYGRSTKGFVLADSRSTAATIGDEPMQFYSKFPGVSVAVCEDRVKGINRLKDEHDIIILDDAYQHRRVSAGLNILLFEYTKLFNAQFMLPAGNLREYFSGFSRADAILITKCPDHIPEQNRKFLVSKFKGKEDRVAFWKLSYGNLISFKDREVITQNIRKETVVFLLSGIANPDPLVNYINQSTGNIRHYKFSDHHNFTVAEIEGLARDFKECPSDDKLVVTTEKDVQRLLEKSLATILLDLPVFYLPIKIEIVPEDSVTFDNRILDYVTSNTGNS